MRLILIAVTILLSLSACGGGSGGSDSGEISQSPATENAPPNIVLIISDDQAWTDYGFMDHPGIETPNLDTLAKQSVVFSRGYVPTPLCRPSLMTLATGHYAHRHGVTGNDPSPKRVKTRSPKYAKLKEALIGKIDNRDTLPELLATQGYLSFQSGKWWEGSFQRGGFSHGMTRGAPHADARHGDEGLKIGREGMQPVQEFIHLAQEKSQPFFLWYAPYLPHAPHNPPSRLLEKYQREGRSEFVAKYYAMCAWFDETVGELMDYLEENNLRDNTLIVFVSDNGWIQSASHAGFAPRSKLTPFEGGVRTPILFSWPLALAAQQRNELVSSIDIVPTLLGAAGIEPPQELPGINLLPALIDQKKIEREIIFGEVFAHDIADINRPEASLLYRWAIEGPWKLLQPYNGEAHRYRKFSSPENGKPQLYNVLADPFEADDVAALHPQIVKRLGRKISDWYPLTGVKPWK